MQVFIITEHCMASFSSACSYPCSNSQQGQQEDIDRVHDHRHLGDIQLHLILQCELGPYPFAETLVRVAVAFARWIPHVMSTKCLDFLPLSDEL